MKKILFSALGLFLACVMLFAAMVSLAACGDSDSKESSREGSRESSWNGNIGDIFGGGDSASKPWYEGVYVGEDGDEIKLAGGKWSITENGITISGPYEKDGDKIIFKVEIGGSTEPAYTGTLDGKTLTIDNAGTFKKK